MARKKNSAVEVIQVFYQMRCFNQEVFVYKYSTYETKRGKIKEVFKMYDLTDEPITSVFDKEDKILKAYDALVADRVAEDWQENDAVWATDQNGETIQVMLPEGKHNLSKSKAVLADNILFSSYKDAGAHLGVSDNAVRKRIQNNWKGYTLYGQY